MKTKLAITALVMTICIIGFNQAQAQVEVEASITRVTVYPQRAMITRSAALDLPAGDHTLIVKNLPGRADENSFRASVKNDIAVLLGLIHRTVRHTEIPQKKVSDMDKAIHQIEKYKLRGILDRREVFDQQKKMLLSIGFKSGEEMSEQLDKGGLEISQWHDAFDFVGKALRAINDSLSVVERELDEIRRQLNKLKADRKAVAGQLSRQSKTVEIDVRMAKAGQVSIDLDYVIGGVSWKPLYDARLDDKIEKVAMNCFGEVRQTTGEDWNDIDLILSTSQPGKGTGPGDLGKWALSLYGPVYANKAFSASIGRIQGTVTDAKTGEALYGVSIQIEGTTLGAKTNFDGDFLILSVPPGTYNLIFSSIGFEAYKLTDVQVNTNQSTERNLQMKQSVLNIGTVTTVRGARKGIDLLETGTRTIKAQQEIQVAPVAIIDDMLARPCGITRDAEGEFRTRGGRACETGYLVDGVNYSDPLFGHIYSSVFSTTFTVTRKVSIQSGDESVRCPIGNFKLDREVEYLCRPKNQEAVYLLATITNQDEIPLMPGPVAIFAGSDYLGKTFLDRFVAPGDEFDLPFGQDNYIEVKREMTENKTSHKGNKIRFDQTIKITLANNSSDIRDISVEEPLPVSQNSQIKVKLQDVQPEKDEPEQEDNSKAVWTVTLKPGEEMDIVLPYRIEYPVGMNLTGL